MIEKKSLCPERLRKISGSFAFIEHRFLRDGFFASLSHHELVLYFFLVLVADRNGLSYYSFDKICTLLTISTDQYLLARNCLIQKDLIAFDGTLFQVLELPEHPLQQPPIKAALTAGRPQQRRQIATLIQQSLWEAERDRYR